MYRLGLDVGIKSVGWCVLECDENGEPIQINALNSRIFDVAEQPNGASLAEPRRLARGLRRRIRRKSFRLERLRKLFKSNGIELFDEQDDLIVIKNEYKDLDVAKLRQRRCKFSRLLRIFFCAYFHLFNIISNTVFACQYIVYRFFK